MTDEAGLNNDPEMDPFDNSSAPELKHTNLSAQFLVIHPQNSQYLPISPDKGRWAPSDANWLYKPHSWAVKYHAQLESLNGE